MLTNEELFRIKVSIIMLVMTGIFIAALIGCVGVIKMCFTPGYIVLKMAIGLIFMPMLVLVVVLLLFMVFRGGEFVDKMVDHIVKYYEE